MNQWSMNKENNLHLINQSIKERLNQYTVLSIITQSSAANNNESITK